MNELAVSAETIAQLRKLANKKGTTTEALAEQALQRFLREEVRRLLRNESDAFRTMHAELLRRYRDEYVAIYQGQLVDHDSDQLALYKRIEEQFSDVPVLIKQVLPEPEELYTFRSPRFENE